MIELNGSKGINNMPPRRAKTDKFVQRILETLRTGYGEKHPKATIEAYRYNPASIRVRIIDPEFRDKDILEREEVVDRILETLPEEVRAEITILLLLTPKERQTSLGSMEFDDPTPSRL
jgi:hypothetical protein